MEGQKETAVHTLNELLYSQPPPHGQRKFRLLLGLIYVHTLAGELAEACTANKKFQALTTNSNYGKAYSSYLQGVIHFYRNELDAGIHCFVQAVDHRHLLLTRVAVDAMAGLSYIYAAMHLPDKVHTTLALLFEYVHDLQDPTLFTLAQSCRARLALMQEDFGAAYQWLETNAPLPVAGLLFWWEVPTITYCRVLVAASSDTSLQEAEKKLQEYLQLSQATHNTCQTIGILLVLALTYHKQARNDEALSVLGQAVLLAQPGGFIRPFLELGRPMADLLKRLIKQNGAVAYVGEILAAFGEDEQSVAVPDTQSALARATRSQPLLVEPLTNREDEILALLGQRLQDKEIATQLFISAETVKSHLKHLYQKLDVRTRRQAVTKAQALGLLSAA